MAASVSGAKLACRFHGGHHLNPQFHGPVGCEARYRGMTVRTAMIGGLSVCHVASVGTQAARICAEAQGQGQILGSDSSNQQRPAPQSGAASTGRQTQRMPSGSPSISPSATLPPSSTFRPLADIICDLNRKVPENLLKIKIDHGFQLKYIPWFHANRMLNFYAPGRGRMGRASGMRQAGYRRARRCSSTACFASSGHPVAATTSLKQDEELRSSSSETEQRQTLSITQPDDWHLHLRDGSFIASVAKHSTEQFARAIIMPNLRPPVTTTDMATQYRDRILAALPVGSNFEPLMTLYLTDNTTPEEIQKAKQSAVVHAIKLYPAGATTNSDQGVSNVNRCMPALERMVEVGLPLLVHGEVTDASVDVFDRERVFIERVLDPLLKKLPKLRVVMEHVTTSDAVDFVESFPEGMVAATVTPQHLLLNRNAIFTGGLRPHNYCLPVLKRESHRRRLIEVVTSGSRQFFLGTDSAPHERQTKESSCGCAGIYSAHAALSLYAHAFEQAGALHMLEAFASFNGPDFYGLPRNTKQITLVKEPWVVPETYAFGDGWHGDVRNITFSPDNKTVTVVYRVTIRGADGEVWRESSGTASTSDDGFGDPVQKAEGMAFRRACARFGLGLHLYHDEDKT
ncbi:hypothetical protein CBR_g21229 [Chara braunii]|uniref:Dihydroorotase, mitochondrial n=1 Tax=Chara braunii TaxID=69332 RepID=A0A388L112_CHABU|nr:hypothetical protein CBR_g21229 [Chara braunii]|eukprot:GBG75987.1 hypothetical protein CBR_g21229 [Chara braunii]